MASTSPLLMVFSQETTTTGAKGQGGSSNNNQDASKSSEQPSSKLPRGRKPSKSSTKSPLYKNKPTRRGMGVEKLERWLQAEKWGGGDHNLPAEVASAFPLHPHHQFQTPTPPHHLIPVAASPSVYVVGSDSLMSKLSSSSSFMAASSKVISTFGGACGKELSSIPKEMQFHQCDASCYYSKNKCMNMEEMQGINLGGMNQDKLVFPSSLINDCHMLTAGHNNVGLEMKDLNSRFMKQMVYSQDSDHQLMGSFTRQAASSSCSNLKEYEFFPPGKGLREYEFFPGTNSGRSYARSSEQPNHYYYSEPAAASSYLIPSSDFSQYHAASATNSNALDLSLKL